MTSWIESRMSGFWTVQLSRIVDASFHTSFMKGWKLQRCNISGPLQSKGSYMSLYQRPQMNKNFDKLQSFCQRQSLKPMNTDAEASDTRQRYWGKPLKHHNRRPSCRCFNPAPRLSQWHSTTKKFLGFNSRQNLWPLVFHLIVCFWLKARNTRFIFRPLHVYVISQYPSIYAVLPIAP